MTTDQLSVLRPQVREFLGTEPLPLLIGAEERHAGGAGTLPVTDPSYGVQVAEAAVGGDRDVTDAVLAAKAALDDPEWREMAPVRLGELLWRLADLVERDGEILAELDALCCGLPIDESVHQVPAAVEDLRYYAGWATKLEGRAIPVGLPGYTVYTRREPVGVCAAITSWNFPIEAFSGKIGPALATRSTVVLKPAELAPLSAVWLGRLVREAGFPPGVVNVVSGDGVVGAALVDHPDVAKIAFTGSTVVGRAIATAAGAGLKRVSMELGGKSPLVICADADLDRAVDSAASAIFRHSGQNCVAASRILIAAAVADEVTARLSEVAGRMRQGPALTRGIQLGPVISRQRRDDILGYVSEAREAGGQVIAGGSPPPNLPTGGFYVSPTLIGDVDPDSRLAQEEVFGPVAALFRFDDLDEALHLARRTKYGLSASIWTRDIATARRYIDRVSAGTVWVNGHVLYDSAAPFGGVGQSGYGRELGAASLDEYTQLKTVWFGD